MTTALAIVAAAGLACGQAGAPAAKPVNHAAPEAEVSKDRLTETLKSLPVKRASWGDDAHSKGLRETEKLLAARLTAMGHVVVLDPIAFMGQRVQDHEGAQDKPYHNLIVDLPGTTAREQVLVMSAHMDAVPGSPGADDDGSGVAVVLEAARVLKGKPTQRSIRLIIFNLEENGLVGSRAYTQRIKPGLEAGTEKIVGMMSLDGIGYFTDEPNSQKSPIPKMGAFEPPSVGDFIGVAGILRFRPFSQALDRAMKAAEPKIKTVVVDFLPVAPPDLLRSDHAPFLGIGVPAVILADTANFRNPHYHQPTDTIETLDLDRLTITARAAIGGLYRLAGPPGTALIDIAPLGPAQGTMDGVPQTPAKAPGKP